MPLDLKKYRLSIIAYLKNVALARDFGHLVCRSCRQFIRRTL